MPLDKPFRLPVRFSSAPRVLALSRPFQARWLFLPLLALAVLLAAAPADAKRFGSGKSFGGKDSYSQSYSKPAPPAKDAGAARQQAGPNPQGAPAQGGFMSKFGGIGGMLGGLLLGGMLGSLLFGGMGGGVGILEIILLCLAGYMVFRVIRSRRAANAAQSAGVERGASAGADGFAYAGAGAHAGHAPSEPVGDGWGALRSAQSGMGGEAAHAAPVLPAGMDEAEFLSGAKALYARMQASWDRRDLDDIRSFTSPEVHAEIVRQAREDSAPGRTDIIMVEARVLEASAEGSRTVISVLFDVLLRENPADDRSSQVREVWHFGRDEAAVRPEWVLEGIQQLES